MGIHLLRFHAPRGIGRKCMTPLGVRLRNPFGFSMVNCITRLANVAMLVASAGARPWRISSGLEKSEKSSWLAPPGIFCSR